MKEHIKRNCAEYELVFSLLQSVMLAVYLAVLGDKLSNESRLFQAIVQCEYYNVILLIVMIILILQLRLIKLNHCYENENKEHLINSILKSACMTLIYPQKERNIRACVTICNYKMNKRITTYSYNIEADPERNAIVDIDFGITGEAIKRKAPVAGALKKNHMEDYSLANRKYICPDIKCVLAAPIFSPISKHDVIGVLAFDSFETIDVMKFDTHQSKIIAQMWADVISDIL